MSRMATPTADQHDAEDLIAWADSLLPELCLVTEEEEDEEEFDEDEGWGYFDTSAPKMPAPSDKIQSSVPENKFAGRINLEPLHDTFQASGAAVGSLKEQQRKNSSMRVREKEKADRATCEQVLDPRTRMILFKLLNRNILETINGCISTGKEANVYHGTLGTKDPNSDATHSIVPLTGGDVAVKIYKTSILVFKDRDRYVNGEFRFRRGYCKSNPRKMVKLWAEKEMRNLVRLNQAGIRCPEPLLLRQHVLVMRFIGKNGSAAPKLKEVTLSEDKKRELYWEAITVMRTIYQKCKLVHADLSEYNILYYKGHLYIIDVSQAVEHDHPNAMRFLQMDCTNMTAYFRRQGIPTMNVRELFEFITDPTLDDVNVDQYLEEIQQRISARPAVMSSEQQMDEEVFKQTFIPRTLNDVYDHERHIVQALDGNTKDMFYKSVVGLSDDYQNPKENQYDEPDQNEEENDQEQDQANDDHSENDEEEEGEEGEVSGDEPHEETPRERQARLESMDKKARKAYVKEMKREKRQTKVPKHIKKRRKKLTKKKT
uniref:Serine/threonine-protein kinase RIO1 n=1 Tax=Vannella robusta TaxID=1487602 RepID=A0A7S4I1Y1_9EUKA